MMTLSKRIPARTKTVTVLWCRKDFLTMNSEYRKVRAKFKNPMTSCYWCQRQMEDGETIALACFEKKGNKVLCQKCATELVEESTK